MRANDPFLPPLSPPISSTSSESSRSLLFASRVPPPRSYTADHTRLSSNVGFDASGVEGA